MAAQEIWNQICEMKGWPTCSFFSEEGLRKIRTQIFKEEWCYLGFDSPAEITAG